MYLLRHNLKLRGKKTKQRSSLEEHAEEEKEDFEPLSLEHHLNRNGPKTASFQWDGSHPLPAIVSDHQLDLPFQALDEPLWLNKSMKDYPITDNTGKDLPSRSMRPTRSVLDGSKKVPVPRSARSKGRLVIDYTDGQAQPDFLPGQNTKATRAQFALVKDTELDGNGDDFDLGAPAQSKKSTGISLLTDSLFSAGHLHTILHNPQLLAKFGAFLNRYRSQDVSALVSYLEIQKSIKAIEYANALAESVANVRVARTSGTHLVAAQIDSSFVELGQKTFQELLSEALPAYVTYNLVGFLSEIMANEIAGRSTPIMSGLGLGLTEVFCLTDPNQEDNPIIYASEAFYHLTGYGRDFAIGKNCRFLQGPNTSADSTRRLRDATKSGQHISETFLNYTRDGRPFLTDLMIAPLHDTTGKVRYHIGAQVDVGGLVEGGRGLESFQKYLAGKTNDPMRDSTPTQQSVSHEVIKNKDLKKRALNKLDELSEMLDLEESAALGQQGRTVLSRQSLQDGRGSSQGTRRIFTDSASHSEEDEKLANLQEQPKWNLSRTGLSGKLPGVYETYLLMRPSPSMKIVFTSPALRMLGSLVQTSLFSHIVAPPATIKGLRESFDLGTPIIAKVRFLAQASQSIGGMSGRGRGEIDGEGSQKGTSCWISATPLLGSDDQVGVWMVVIVGGKGRITSSSTFGDASTSKSNTQDSNSTGVGTPKMGVQHRLARDSSILATDSSTDAETTVRIARMDYATTPDPEVFSLGTTDGIGGHDFPVPPRNTFSNTARSGRQRKKALDAPPNMVELFDKDNSSSVDDRHGSARMSISSALPKRVSLKEKERIDTASAVYTLSRPEDSVFGARSRKDSAELSSEEDEESPVVQSFEGE